MIAVSSTSNIYFISCYFKLFVVTAFYRSFYFLYFYCMSTPSNIPVFNKRIFWDVNFDKLDYDGKANFIIERVFERGDVPDIRNCRRYYGDEKISQALLKAKYLPERRLHLASAVIDKPVTEFRCYTLKRSNPGLTPY